MNAAYHQKVWGRKITNQICFQEFIHHFQWHSDSYSNCYSRGITTELRMTFWTENLIGTSQTTPSEIHWSKNKKRGCQGCCSWDHTPHYYSLNKSASSSLKRLESIVESISDSKWETKRFFVFSITHFFPHADQGVFYMGLIIYCFAATSNKGAMFEWVTFTTGIWWMS